MGNCFGREGVRILQQAAEADKRRFQGLLEAKERELQAKVHELAELEEDSRRRNQESLASQEIQASQESHASQDTVIVVSD